MLLVYLLKWLGIIDPKHTVVRHGVINFAVYVVATRKCRINCNETLSPPL